MQPATANAIATNTIEATRSPTRVSPLALLRRGLAWAAYPAVVILLARYVVVPDVLSQWGRGDSDEVASRASVAVFGLVLLAVAPALIGFWVACDGRGAPVQRRRREFQLLLRIAIGAVITTVIARVLWVGPGFDLETAARLFGFWLAWAAFVFGVACAARRVGAGASVIVAAPTLIGFAAVTSVFWIDAGLSRALTSATDGPAMIDAAVSWSPFTGYLVGVFEFSVFKSGHMYLNPAADGGGLSCIGEYMPGGYRYPAFIVWIARWPAIGLAAYVTAIAWQRLRGARLRPTTT